METQFNLVQRRGTAVPGQSLRSQAMCDGTSSYVSDTQAVISSFRFCGNDSKPMKKSRWEGRNPAKCPLAKGNFRGRICRRWSLSLPSAPQPRLIREIRLPFDFLPAAGLNSLTDMLLPPASFSCFLFPPSSWVLSPSQVPRCSHRQ